MHDPNIFTTPQQESAEKDLDPYKAAPQVLRDLWKSWTKTKAPYPNLGPLLAPAPAPKVVPEAVLESEFQIFVLGHLFTLFHEDPKGFEAFLEGVLSSKSSKYLTLENALPSGTSSQKAYLKEEFLEIVKPKLLLLLSTSYKFKRTSESSFVIKNIPGLLVLPELFPPVVQQCLLDVLLHREFSRPEHQTNFHLNYEVSYPEDAASFFSTKPESSSFTPKDPSQNKPLLNRTALEKSLHWITLGGQYDWTNKVYPSEVPPKFAEDIARLVGNIFTDMNPEAAIINVYSSRDKLSMHRDVSEEADRGLVSISLGCACIFVIAIEDKSTGELNYETLRLRSGDAVYMGGESRYAWHGVPKIIPDTCPEYLQYWPGKRYPGWEGWMSKKRINLNIRQMFEYVDSGCGEAAA